MSLTVKFNGPRLLGVLPPSRVPYIINSQPGGLQIGSLSDYLDGLFDAWKTCLSEGLRRFSYIHWNGSANARESTTRTALLGIIDPIFRTGTIPDQISSDDLQTIGVSSKEEFEECLFHLINELIALDEASQI